MTPASNDAATREVAAKIRAEIRARGPIPFARFMQLALYCPQSGYYERIENTPGRRGDFYTSVSVGGLFGELLAGRFASWFRAAGLPAPMIVEAGAQDGRLAEDILTALRTVDPDVFARIRYVVVEPSSVLRRWQTQRLESFREKVHWTTTLDELGRQAVSGVVFGNELLDAMPCHRLVWDRPERRWAEWGVREAGEGFAWERMDLTAEAAAGLSRAPGELLDALPDGYCMEVSPAGLHWVRTAAEILRRGWLVLLDYGFPIEERWAAHRPAGTLRAYAGHRIGGGVLENPGGQDVTFQVDFGAVQEAGQSAGLVTQGLWRQETFFTTIVSEVAAIRHAAERWDPARRRQFQTLVHPQHLGRLFRVLVQSRLPPEIPGSCPG